jgi:hypothetical protein
MIRFLSGQFEGISLSRSRILNLVIFVLLLATPSAWPQAAAPKAAPSKSSAAKAETTVITSVKVVMERGVPSVEILSTRPAVPSIQFENSPPRLVIDLLHAQMGLSDKKIEGQQENIISVRAEQFQKDPPVARIVLELASPYSYTWDEAGNRLMVRLRPAEDNSAGNKKTPSRTARTGALSLNGAGPSVVPVTGGGGEVRIAGSQIAAGSTLMIGPDTTVLQLSRGGEVRLCPRSTVSVTPSKNGKDLMLGMNLGALETHYSLESSADTVMTPDFRILFAGPGEFDFAVSTDAKGNTCVRGLSGNGSSAIVSELLGDRIYQVRPNEQAVFRAGRIDKVDANVPVECGCPPVIPVMRANSGAAPVAELPAKAKLTQDAGSTKPAQKLEAGGSGSDAAKSERSRVGGRETEPPPPSKPEDIHVQVEAPLVFNGKKHTEPPPAQTEVAEALPTVGPAPPQSQLEIQIQPPPAKQSGAPTASGPRRFFKRIGGIFSAIFH